MNNYLYFNFFVYKKVIFLKDHRAILRQFCIIAMSTLKE